MVARRERGERVEGVRMRRVRAVSMGARMMWLKTEDTVVTRRVATGVAVVRISGVGIPEVEMEGRSVSGRPSTAAIRERKNVSAVLSKML